MKRRRPVIGGLQTEAAARDQYRLLGENVAKLKTDLMKEQLATFRSQLDEFARKHKILGTVFEVISIGRRNLVRSVPTELNRDHNEILELPQVQMEASDAIMTENVLLEMDERLAVSAKSFIALLS